MDVRNTGGNKYETTAREIQNYQFSTFFSRSKMTSRKVTATALKVNVKKFQPTSTSSLACVLTNLDAFCPMEVHLPGEKSILPYFSSPRGVGLSIQPIQSINPSIQETFCYKSRQGTTVSPSLRNLCQQELLSNENGWHSSSFGVW